MSIDPANAFSQSSSRALKRSRGPTRKLPDEIDFLRDLLPLERLEHVATMAKSDGVCANEVLIAEGWLDEPVYYARLASEVGAEFTMNPSEFSAGADWRAALRTGVIRLADGRWLMAPRGAAVAALLQRVTPPSQAVVIATPSAFERGVFGHFARDIADEGAELLSRIRPDLCARSRGGAMRMRLGFLLCVLVLAEIVFAMQAWVLVTFAIAAIMCVAVLVRILATLVALRRDPVPRALPQAELPFYSVVVALYDEAQMAARLIGCMSALDYPVSKHEVIFVVEANDAATRIALETAGLPPHARIIVAPAGAPRTKPRALNIGLLVARGDLLVIYDAEDRPEPDQLRKAAARFAAGAPDLAVLQARLRVENRSDTWLTQLFALDYAVQFELLLPGMARLGAPLPLGGTSNHFRTDILRGVGGWDAWNVTEDADLGLRLARHGYGAQTLDSVTREEAPPTLRDWFPQRRRWLKGWMQTAVTHTRHPTRLLADLGALSALHAVALLAANTLGPAIGLWITLYVLHESLTGDFLAGDGGQWGQLVWVWAGLAGLGLVSIVLPTCIAIIGGRLWTCAPFLLLRPVHWLCVSAASFHALYDLWASPHHWSKTRHGLARKRN